MYVLVYSSWDVYSQCSKTCGDGQRTRERTCIGGICSRATSQDLIETEVCNQGPCAPPDLFVKASSSSGGGGTCRSWAGAGHITGRFWPVGSLKSDTSRIVYTKEKVNASSMRYYLYKMNTGKWEFTNDYWLKSYSIDYTKYGTRKFQVKLGQNTLYCSDTLTSNFQHFGLHTLELKSLFPSMDVSQKSKKSRISSECSANINNFKM